VAKFRQDYPKVSMIFTTRDLSLGGDFGLEKKLEMQPLTEAQMQAFVRSYVPEQAEAMLRQLKDRLREFGQTPLLLWMLCGLFRQTGQIPANLGEVFRAFTQGYEKNLKADVPVESDRRWWPELLQELAFWMMRGVPFDEEAPAVDVEFRVAISKVEARQIFAAFLQNKEAQAEGVAQKYLDDLLRHHLIQSNGEQVEFRHQMLQEYYAAEYLLNRIGQIGDLELKKNYLNYLKWTEAVALALALMQDKDSAIRVVKQSLDLDLILGAKLSGQVKRGIQTSTVSIICDLEVPEWLRIDLLVATQSAEAIFILQDKLQHGETDVRQRITWKSEKLYPNDAIYILQLSLKDSDPSIRKLAVSTLRNIAGEQVVPELINALQDPDFEVCEQAIIALEKLDATEMVIPLLKILNSSEPNLGTQNRDLSVALSLDESRKPYWDIVTSAEHTLKNLEIEVLISGLREAINNPDYQIRKRAIRIAKEREDDRLNTLLFEASLDLDLDVHEEAFNALKLLRDKKINQIIIKKKQREAHEREIDIYLDCINSQDPIRRGNALSRLVNIVDKNTAISWTIEALDDLHEYVRGHAIRILEELSQENALPYIIKALSDSHCNVRSSATQALLKLSTVLSLLDLEIPEATIIKCISSLNKEENQHIRYVEAQTLLNLCSVLPNLLLRSDLEEAFLNASISSYNTLRSTAARGLGRIGSEISSSRLLEMIQDSDILVSSTVSEVLGTITSEHIGKLLPGLEKLTSTSAGNFALHAISGIQTKCKYYNYDITQTTQFMKLFFSYAHKDEPLRDELAKHLSLLKRQNIITDWHDRNITAGTDWAQAIDHNLNTADIILLLISSDFLASDYCYDKEMTRALERHDKSTARVIPIILRPCDWHSAPFGKLQALPKDAKPVTEWDNQDKAFTNIAQGIRKAVAELQQRKSSPAAPQPKAASSQPANVTMNFYGTVHGAAGTVQGDQTIQPIK
jgi:HEAT repeat protein